jgi:hypothetical protein
MTSRHSQVSRRQTLRADFSCAGKRAESKKIEILRLSGKQKEKVTGEILSQRYSES